MEHKDFAIGEKFFCNNQTWLCTDIGTRSITAIYADIEDHWLKGPPYAMAEIVFNEYDFPGCFKVPGKLQDDGFRPDWYSPPGDTISCIMQERGIREEDLIQNGRFTAEEIKDLLEGDLVIDPPMAAKIASAFGSTPTFWLRREQRYRKDKARLEGNRHER